MTEWKNADITDFSLTALLPAVSSGIYALNGQLIVGINGTLLLNNSALLVCMFYGCQ